MRKSVKMLVASGLAATAVGAGMLISGVGAQSNPGEQQATPAPVATPRTGAGASGQAQQTRAQRSEEWLNRLAQNLGISVDRLRQALQQTALQGVDAAVAAGRLTPEQAQQARERINSGQVPFGPGGFGHGPGGGRGFGPRADHAELAQFLGITVEQLRTELQTSTLAQVAQAHGRSRDQLKQFLTNSFRQHLTQAVQNGRLTQQQADAMLNRYTQNLDNLIDRQPGTRGPRGMMPGSTN